MTIYQLGEDVRFTATIVDTDGVATDPTTVTISIRRPDRTMAVTTQTMTNSVTGTYYYDYTITAEDTGQEGKYIVKVTATGSGGRITIEPDEFTAEASI